MNVKNLFTRKHHGKEIAYAIDTEEYKETGMVAVYKLQFITELVPMEEFKGQQYQLMDWHTPDGKRFLHSQEGFFLAAFKHLAKTKKGKRF